MWILWAGFIAYALFLAPPIQPGTWELLRNLFTLQWTQINPIILSLFSLIGIWLLIYSCVLFIDSRMQKIPAWPFVLAAVGSGVIGLLPYLAMRQPNSQFSGPKDSWIRFWDSRTNAIILSISTAVIVGYGLLGSWSEFAEQWQTERFVHVMSLAFCLFALLFPTVLGDDMARRGLSDRRIFWAVALVPLVGPLAYLCLRPGLPEPATANAATPSQPASARR